MEWLRKLPKPVAANKKVQADRHQNNPISRSDSTSHLTAGDGQITLPWTYVLVKERDRIYRPGVLATSIMSLTGPTTTM